MISVRDVHKVFRQGGAEVPALAGVSLDIAAGEFVSIMGPSGSGKSTLLHLMGGLDVPTAGEILIDGSALSRMTDDEITIFRRRKIGFVFQFFNLLPTYSAEENVALPLLLDRRRPRDVRERVRVALEQVGRPLPVVACLAEKRSVEDGAPEPEMEIVLPGEADATVQLRRDARGAIVEVAQVCLGDRGVTLGALDDVVVGMRGVPPEGERGIQLGSEIGELVLDR